MSWQHIQGLGFLWMCAASLSVCMTTPHVAVAASAEQPQASATSPQLRPEAASREVEKRLNAEFSRMSERYQREVQRGEGSDEQSHPHRTEQQRQALQDIEDRDPRTPADPHLPQRQRNRRLLQFQLQLDPLE